MKDTIKLSAIVKIKNLRTGEVTEFKNLVTSLGLSLYADRIMNNAVDFIDYIGIGDGAGTHTISSITLYNEIFRKIATSKSNPGATSKFTFTIFGNEAVGSWTELGMFNAVTGGTMTNVVEVNYTHAAGDDLEITWEVSFT